MQLGKYSKIGTALTTTHEIEPKSKKGFVSIQKQSNR